MASGLSPSVLCGVTRANKEINKERAHTECEHADGQIRQDRRAGEEKEL
jgi:hypothetical protein